MKACTWLFLLLCWWPWAAWAQAPASGCQACHPETIKASPFHQNLGCVACHQGQDQTPTQTKAHQGLIRHPGDSAQALASCGQSGCHGEWVQAMQNSVMMHLGGMLAKTRRLFGQEHQDRLDLPLHQRLSQRGADSYLRKLCVSCHLGQPRTNYEQNLTDRGGGCLACHLEKGAEKEHPRLTAQVADQRCFGCHSRSGRISLTFAGLAEQPQIDPQRPQDFARLPDGRVVEKLPPDVHFSAGLGCTDCHTAKGVMGQDKAQTYQRQQLDIGCPDCHQLGQNWLEKKNLSKNQLMQASLRQSQIPERIPATRAYASPLFQLQTEPDQVLLQARQSGRKHQVEQVPPNHGGAEHQRLSCEACHAAWAPQCYGCHIRYEPKEDQVDHLLGQATPGRWIERLWQVENAPPSLGVDQAGRIHPFVPGMNVILEQTGRSPIKHRLYSPLSPHSTQRQVRSCASCHQTPLAWGQADRWLPAPHDPKLRVPHGWFFIAPDAHSKSLEPGARSLNRQEIARIKRVGQCLTCHPETAPLWKRAQPALQNLPADAQHRPFLTSTPPR